MRVNERNESFISRMKQFILHCQLRAQHMQAAHIAVGLPLQAQKAMLEQHSDTAAIDHDSVHPESEAKVADDSTPYPPLVVAVADTVVLSSPLEKHAIFGLSEEGDQPLPALTPLSSLSRLTSLRSPPLSAVPSVVATPRHLYSGPLTPSTTTHNQQPPPFVALPTSLSLFSPPPLSTIPSPHPLLDDDSPPSHIRSQSATAAVRASSRLTSFPRSNTLHRRSITANTVARELPASVEAAGRSRGGSSAALERLMEDQTTTEIRLVREQGATGGWRVERGVGGEEDVGANSRTGEAETRATASALPRGSFSEVAQLSRSAREIAGSAPSEEKEVG